MSEKKQLTHEQKFVQDMLKSAENKNQEKKILLAKDTDMHAVENIVKDLQDKLIKNK